jgi:hypothetical protein
MPPDNQPLDNQQTFTQPPRIACARYHSSLAHGTTARVERALVHRPKRAATANDLRSLGWISQTQVRFLHFLEGLRTLSTRFFGGDFSLARIVQRGERSKGTP